MAILCIDERRFEQIHAIPEIVDQLITVLTRFHETDSVVFKSSDLDYVEVQSDLPFCSILYDENLDLIDQEERMLLIQAVNRCVIWDADNVPLLEGEVFWEGSAEDSNTVRFATSRALEGDATGIIGPEHEHSTGKVVVTIDDHETELFLVGLSENRQPFYRFAICFEKMSREEFSRHSHLAFERLRFALDLRTQLGNFRQNYDAVRETIVAHLAAISDEFLTLLLQDLTLSDICTRVQSLRGIAISPESTRTHRDASKMKLREVSFEGELIVCEFHTKLTPTYDRIHFSPTRRMNEETDFLVVGMFEEHLPT